jgi:hypothetical protein
VWCFLHHVFVSIEGCVDSISLEVDSMYIVSRMHWRWRLVTWLETYTIIVELFVSGNRPLVLAQNEYPQVKIECVGIFVNGGVSISLASSVCSWSRSIIHGRLCGRLCVLY